jgi:hypothetical protein
MWKTAMPERSSVDPPAATGTPRPTWTRSGRLALLLLNAAPLFHLVLVSTAVVLAPGLALRIGIAITGIYLLPPLAVRLLFAVRPVRHGTHALGSPDFLVWWASAQAQMLFCRLPFLEEILRLVPGLYSLWLRLWGAQIGRLTYWSPGLRILDRSFVVIGDDVVFGAGVRLNAHVIADAENGSPVLHLAPIHIGTRCRIGGYALLTAGTVVGEGQCLKALSLSPPFTVWEEGRRTKIAVPK